MFIMISGNNFLVTPGPGLLTLSSYALVACPTTMRPRPKRP
jgi:hypothetical protein